MPINKKTPKPIRKITTRLDHVSQSPHRGAKDYEPGRFPANTDVGAAPQRENAPQYKLNRWIVEAPREGDYFDVQEFEVVADSPEDTVIGTITLPPGATYIGPMDSFFFGGHAEVFKWNPTTLELSVGSATGYVSADYIGYMHYFGMQSNNGLVPGRDNRKTTLVRVTVVEA